MARDDGRRVRFPALVVPLTREERQALERTRLARFGAAPRPALDQWARELLVAVTLPAASAVMAAPVEPVRPPLPEVVAAQERAAIVAALETTSQNQTRAAIELGISRRALIGKMEKHGLKPRPSTRRRRRRS